MNPVLRTLVIPVTDLASSKALYASVLGADPVMDEPYYVQFDGSGVEVGLDPHGHAKGLTGPVGYWHVDDLDKALALALEAGASQQGEVNDFGGRLVVRLADGDGNPFGFIQTTA